MTLSVKRAISLPREQDEKLKKMAKVRKMAYSSLIQIAVQGLLETDGQNSLEQAYRDYYANKGHHERTLKLVRNFQNLSSRAWKS